MKDYRASTTRGVTEIDWLTSRHSFSFGGYHQADRVSHGALRVLNDDIVDAGQGFGAHPHRNAEIVSYVLSGALQHKDSLGNGGVITAGQFQYMSAGSGVTHSEFNPGRESAHFLQIWLLPNVQNAKPAYQQVNRAAEPGLQLIAAPAQAPIAWRSDARLWLGQLTDEATSLPISGSRGYLHLIKGSLELDDLTLAAGDALALTDEPAVHVNAGGETEFLWFDLA